MTRLVAARGRARATGHGLTALILALAATASCGDANAALEHVVDAQRISADLLVQFTSSADAANRAVMADTDEASVAFARESEQATQATQKDVDALGPLLQGLGYTDETRILQEFTHRFADYRTLDRRILDLAVENTNLKAQRLSFGPAEDAADAFKTELESLAPAVASDSWKVKALAAAGVAAIRETQVLQAPHIADADDAVMTRLEARMAASEVTAQRALGDLAPVVDQASRARLQSATAALNQFITLHTQILSLSRRNTNVRSLALSLNEKPAMATACLNSLHALRDALGKRGYSVARWK